VAAPIVSETATQTFVVVPSLFVMRRAYFWRERHDNGGPVWLERVFLAILCMAAMQALFDPPPATH
jgi:hypothetical protein